MAAVAEKKDRASKFDTQVDEQLAQATSRIRAHDLAFGGLLVAALVLVYATAMIVLDKSLVLPEWVRQLALAGFLGLLASVGYFTLLRPLRRRINPLYAAKQVERTIDDNKNSVTGYVDAQERADLNPTVKAALARRAADAAAEADVNRAVDHRSLIYVGGVAVAFLLTLIVLFFVFRPAPFASLVSRTFVPFTPTPIANQTTLRLVKPEPAEPIITVGHSVTVAVYVEGKVPAPSGPDRVRLLIRHNPLDTNFDELPMVQGETSRDWELRVPDYLIQNGFWYKVAGGDYETPEYRVTVRSLPMFKEFQATYEYPKYLRRASETANDPAIRAYRGTKVTLLATANRELRDGLMVIEPGNNRVTGTPVAGKPDSLKFEFKLAETGRYKLTFNATNGEPIAEPFAAPITVEADLPPQIVINKPEEDEGELPANGQLVVDGKVGDDFGIDTVTLRMKIVEPAERPLPDVPYLNGKETSFRRAKDDTWPTDLQYKGSVDLAKLTKGPEGSKVELTADTVIEYWLEATDNCTEPKPNVGRSAPKRVRLTPPKTVEADKMELDQNKEARQNEEQKHNAQQKQKFDTEKREPKNGQPQKEPEKKNGESQPGAKGEEKNPDAKPEPKEGEPKDGGPKGDPKNGGTKGEPKGEPKNDNKGGMGMGQDMGTPKGPNDPNNKGGMNDMGGKEPAPPPKSADQKDIDKTAKEFEDEVNREQKNGGSPKPNSAPNEKDRANPGEAKPQPKDGMMGMNGMGNAAETKPEPKQADGMNPMKGDAAPSSSKPAGDVEKPQDPSAPKPEPKKGGMNGDQKEPAPSERRGEPFGGPAGSDKETPKEPQPKPQDPNAKQDPASGSEAKPATQKKDGDNAGMPGATDKKDPAAEAGTKSKPMPENTRGADKPAQPKGAPPQDTKPGDKPDAGDAKPEKAPPAAGTKPKPQEDMMPGGMNSEAKPSEGANDTKPDKPNATGAAETKPDDAKKPPMGGQPDVAKGMDKPSPGDKGEKGTQNAGGNPPKEQKLDPEQMKKLDEAAKNLNSPDPKKQDEARKTLDKAVGEQNRKEMEKFGKDLQSDDKATRDAAQKKLDDLKKQAGGGQGQQADKTEPKKLDEKQQKELADAAKDLASKDPEKKKAAQDKLDKMIGENNRKELEQVANDLQSDDKEKRDAARQKVEQWKKAAEDQARKDGKQLDPKQLDPQKEKEIADALKDLRGDDQAKKEAARKKLDETVGRDTRERAEDLFNDLDSKDSDKQKQGEKKLEEWRKESEAKDLMNKAKDLQAKDDKRRQDAQKDLDEKLGKENRQKLEEMMKNRKPGDMADEEKLKKELEELAKNAPKKPEPKDWREGLGSGLPNKGAMEEDKKNRVKTAELNLERFESDEYRKKLQAQKGWTDEEYDRFLEGYKKRIEEMKNELASGDKPPVPGVGPDPGKPFDSIQSGKVESTKPGTGAAGVGGPTAAPPGFEKAREKFEEALKRKKP